MLLYNQYIFYNQWLRKKLVKRLLNFMNYALQSQKRSYICRPQGKIRDSLGLLPKVAEQVRNKSLYRGIEQ